MQSIVESAPQKRKRGNPYRDANGKFCSRSEASFIVDANGALKPFDNRANPYHDPHTGKFASKGGTVLTGQAAHDSVPKGLYKEGSLTPEQSAALSTYETGWSMVLNDFLRSKRQGDPDYADEAKVVDTLDSAMNESVLAKPIQTHRGMLNSKVVFGDSFDSDLTGFQWDDLGYGSTTTDRSIANDVFTMKGAPTSSPKLQGDVVMKVNVPAGTKALQVSTSSKGSDVNGPQAEIMLQRGLTWKVVKDNGFTEQNVRDLEVSVSAIGG